MVICCISHRLLDEVTIAEGPTARTHHSAELSSVPVLLQEGHFEQKAPKLATALTTARRHSLWYHRG